MDADDDDDDDDDEEEKEEVELDSAVEVDEEEERELPELLVPLDELLDVVEALVRLAKKVPSRSQSFGTH